MAPSPEPRAGEWIKEDPLPVAQPAYEEKVNQILENRVAGDGGVPPAPYPNVLDVQSGVPGVPDYIPQNYQYNPPTEKERSPEGHSFSRCQNTCYL